MAGEDDQRRPERDEETGEREAGAHALLQVQGERGERQPVTQRGQEDRADEQLEASPLHRGAG